MSELSPPSVIVEPASPKSDDFVENPLKISRRTMLRMMLFALGSASGLSSVFSSELSDLDSLSSGGPLLLPQETLFPNRETLAVGNIQIQPIVTEHREIDWKRNGVGIKRAISGSDQVVPEYFPYEYRQLLESRVLGQLLRFIYTQRNKLFDHVQEYCLQEGKEVWVVDPAYSEAMIVFRFLLNLPVSGGVASVTNEGIDQLFTMSKEASKTTRKEMLKLLMNGGVTSAVFLTTTSLLGSSNEEVDFRRLFVSEAFERLGSMLSQGTTFASIYPDEHWKKIRYYLDRPELRRQKLAGYIKTFRDLPLFREMLRVRHYKVINGQWIAQPGFLIEDVGIS